MTANEEAAALRLTKYKAKVGTQRASDIDAASELIADAMAAWMQTTKWGMFPGLDPGVVAVAALSRVREERAEHRALMSSERHPRL